MAGVGAGALPEQPASAPVPVGPGPLGSSGGILEFAQTLSARAGSLDRTLGRGLEEGTFFTAQDC